MPSYVISDIGAAFLWAQLEHAVEMTARRIAVWEAHHAEFEDLENEGRLRRPVVPDYCSHNAHMYYVLLDARRDRVQVIQHLNGAGVYAVAHYVPLHSSPAGVRYLGTSAWVARRDGRCERRAAAASALDTHDSR